MLCCGQGGCMDEEYQCYINIYIFKSLLLWHKGRLACSDPILDLWQSGHYEEFFGCYWFIAVFLANKANNRWWIQHADHPSFFNWLDDLWLQSVDMWKSGQHLFGRPSPLPSVGCRFDGILVYTYTYIYVKYTHIHMWANKERGTKWEFIREYVQITKGDRNTLEE